MSSKDIIMSPISEEMKQFELYFRKYMKSKTPLLNVITNYIIKRKGKQMRPMFVFLTAKLNGVVNDSTYHAAAVIELLHTATLTHDDVVDEANERRGFFSINALWKNKIAVLVGDYLLSKGLLLAIENNEFNLLRIASDAVREMIEGELLQIEKARKLDINESVYFDIIRKKTAALIIACTAGGAKSVGASDDLIEKMKLFGEYIGIAFQIKDDLFDYDKNGLIGKPTGNDIREKKMTLPLIYALNNSSPTDKKRILKIISKKNKTRTQIDKVIAFAKEKKGLEYSTNKMHEYRDKALEILNTFPEGEARKSLTEIVYYTTNRKK